MKQELVSQYKASLSMLNHVITLCPDKLWADTSYTSPYWQIAYHSLHFTMLYLAPNEALFTPWPNHRPGIHQLGALANVPYTKDSLQSYAMIIINSLDNQINEQAFASPSGFDWLPISKLELYLYNLRHLQHHTGQLVERLHKAGISGIDWVGFAN